MSAPPAWCLRSKGLTDAAYEAWQLDVWNALFNAAQTQYFTQQQDIQAQIAALEDSLRNVDTLTLRREENEEIMKGVLRWLLGPNFHFMPNDVVVQFIQQMPIPMLNPNGNIDITHGTVLDATRGDGLNVTAAGWYPMFMYQEMVKFINEAIEWENVLYFLYGYFWDVAPELELHPSAASPRRHASGVPARRERARRADRAPRLGTGLGQLRRGGWLWRHVDSGPPLHDHRAGSPGL
jgi:hypothetical protein